MFKNTFIHNVVYAFLSQFISLSLSIIMSLFLPKMLGLTDYSYFQLFLFYSSYSGFLLLGLNDGIYLKSGGKKWSELDKKSIGIQWKLSIIFQMTCAAFVILFLLFTKSKLDEDRIFVIIATSFYMLIYNTWGYFGYVFQAVNETKIYSKSIMIDRFGFLICIIMLFLFKNQDYRIYIILYTITKFLSMIYILYLGKEIVYSGFNNIRKYLSQAFENISIGCNLMFASIASMLILGIGRMTIDATWGIETFGKFSFALSLTNFFLQFISQVSMVLFPTLRTMQNEKQEKIFEFMNEIMFLFLPIIYLIYPFIMKMLSIWLPQYNESLYYLGILLPICLFDGKMSLLYNTYFKVRRFEKQLLYINLLTMILSAILSFISVFLFRNMYFVLISMVISITFRSLISSYFIENQLNSYFKIENCTEVLYSILFMFLMYKVGSTYTFIILSVCYIIILVLYKEKLRNYIKFFHRGK